MKDCFSGYHPTVNFLYFTCVLLFSMIFMHPVCLGISLVCSFVYSVYLNGRKALKFNIKYMLPLLLITALINPAFNHEGQTILTYLSNGNPVTLESVVYGVAAAAMLISVICWFSCYNSVITSDKFVYLFGRVIPSLSLIFSMTLRFVPRFKAQFKVVSNAQKCVGRDVENGGVWQRVRNAVTILSIMVTWSLESAIETADSMKSRGYGLKGRTAFSIYRFDKRDKAALLFYVFCGIYIVLGGALGGIEWRYFPSVQGAVCGLHTVSIYICYFLLCISPVIIDVREDRKWKALKSGI
ncbi:MAG: energy-coupling factor transporter transmembrane component T [Bacillota bacterium]|jgi:energy-coupling factor transport system permease protein